MSASGAPPEPVFIAETHPFGPWVARADQAVDEAMDRFRGHPVLDRVFYTASALADWSLLWHLVGVAGAVAHHRRLPDALRLSAALGLESLAVNQGVKRFFQRRRPSVEVVVGPVLLRRPTTSSFPSGHASAGFCAATMLSRQYPAATPFWYALAVVVSASRIHVRMHHTSDVVVGAALGVVLGRVAVGLLGPHRPR